MKIPFRPLGKVRDIVQATGLDISYAYDDLVFSDNSVFILRFDDQNLEKLYLYFNAECNTQEANVLEKRLIIAGKIGGFEIITAGKFEVSQIEGKEELEVKFLQ